jgi:hypothetical protein
MYNSTDETLNDFLFVSKELGILPSKTILYEVYRTKDILEYIDSIVMVEIHTKEIISDYDEDNKKIKIIHQRKLIKIGKNIYVNFVIVNEQDKEESHIKDITLLYNGNFTEFELGKDNLKKRLSDLIEELDEFVKEEKEDEEELIEEDLNLFGVINMQGNLALQKISKLPTLEGNIKKYYNSEVYKDTKSIFKEIKKSNKGLSLFFGERGTGKTTLISHFLSKSEKKVIWIPISLIEQIMFSDFNNFLVSNKNSIIVIDDSENFFTMSNQKSGIHTNYLIQLIDGFFSDTLNLNIILILNTEEDLIDENLFDCNNLIGYVEFGELDDDKIEKLKEDLDINEVIGKKLVNVLKTGLKVDKQSNIGFH